MKRTVLCPPVGLQKEFFQDDVYPDTAVCWEPALTASAWLANANGQQAKISLKPADMTPGRSHTHTHTHYGFVLGSGFRRAAVCVSAVSEAPKEAPVRKYLPSSVYLEEKTDEQKKEEVTVNWTTAALCPEGT